MKRIIFLYSTQVPTVKLILTGSKFKDKKIIKLYLTLQWK